MSDDDDDDMNSADVHNMLESNYQSPSYHRHPNGFADHRMPSDWHLGRNSYSIPVETSGDHDMVIKPALVALLVALRYARCLATVIGESGFEAQAGLIIVSGYSGVCFEIKFSGRHRGFDGVLFNLRPLANQY